MEIYEAIHHILDGESMVIFGAGASLGAKNSAGAPFPSGALLAESLYRACGVTSADSLDLTDAAQLYEEKFSPYALVSEIRAQLGVGSVEWYHEVIYSLPWIRYYTTNYDDVAFIAARKAGKTITPITLDKDFRRFRDYSNISIHINGHIGNLSESTIHSQFKMTSISYLSSDNINNSQWGALFREDLEVAKAIIIIGLSLTYDLDLSRLIHSSNTKSKILIIDSPTLSQDNNRKLERFGNVYTIGMLEFANVINQERTIYTPKTPDSIDYSYSCFDHEYKKGYPLTKPTPHEVFDLFMNGNFADSLTHEYQSKYDSMIYRKEINQIIEAIKINKRAVFLHSDLGNGKTIMTDLIRHQLSRENIHVLTYKESYQAKMSVEIANICNIKEKVVVIFDDYTDRINVIKKFSAYDCKALTFIFTARSAISITKLPEIFDILYLQENESIIIDLNQLDISELQSCSNIFTRYGIWGKLNAIPSNEKVNLLKDRQHGNSSFQTILLDVARSNDMSERIDKIVNSIKNNSENYYEALILVLLSQVMQLRLSINDINEIMNINVLRDTNFQTNTAVNELINFVGGKAEYKIKSSVTTNNILSRLNNGSTIIAILSKTANLANKYSYAEKYNEILIGIISYSRLNSFVKDFPNKKDFLLRYYDEIGALDFYKENQFFWLQYAISCIETEEFIRAQKYLDNAYGYAPTEEKGFIPFQINNQQARLYLELIEKEKSTDIAKDLYDAHKLLMLPIVSRRDNEENVVRLFRYYCHSELQKQLKHIDRNILRAYYRDAYTRLDKYIKLHPLIGGKYIELRAKLMKLAVI